MSTRVPGHHHSWYSPAVGRTMHVRWFGHGGARVLAFPTTMGNHNEWPDRYMPDVLGEAIRRGWIQLWCLDHNHDLSWYDKRLSPRARARQHLRYDAYLTQELLPFTEYVNGTPYVIATGASFGAYHAVCFGMRHPERVDRIIGMSGIYDITWLTGETGDDLVYACNPYAFAVREWEPGRVRALQRQDIILAVGRGDPAYEDNAAFSGRLWERGIGNALRTWEGHAHDWPFWERMIVQYIGGHD